MLNDVPAEVRPRPASDVGICGHRWSGSDAGAGQKGALTERADRARAPDAVKAPSRRTQPSWCQSLRDHYDPLVWSLRPSLACAIPSPYRNDLETPGFPCRTLVSNDRCPDSGLLFSCRLDPSGSVLIWPPKYLHPTWGHRDGGGRGAREWASSGRNQPRVNRRQLATRSVRARLRAAAGSGAANGPHRASRGGVVTFWGDYALFKVCSSAAHPRRSWHGCPLPPGKPAAGRSCHRRSTGR